MFFTIGRREGITGGLGWESWESLQLLTEPEPFSDLTCPSFFLLFVRCSLLDVLCVSGLVILLGPNITPAEESLEISLSVKHTNANFWMIQSFYENLEYMQFVLRIRCWSRSFSLGFLFRVLGGGGNKDRKTCSKKFVINAKERQGCLHL